MKYSVKLTREDGKTVTLAANDYIDIDVNAGNNRIASLTLRHDDNFEDDGAADVLYDDGDEPIYWIKK